MARWDRPDYVRTQARERLGWVVPGETGYKVVDANGKPLGGGAEITADTPEPQKPQDAWWAKLWGSVEAADQPAPVKRQAQAGQADHRQDQAPLTVSSPRVPRRCHRARDSPDAGRRVSSRASMIISAANRSASARSNRP